jgi:hypothetical protein
VSDAISLVLRRPAGRCFAAFCDVRRLTEWVPNLRRARVVVDGDDGRPREVLFEFGDKLTYSLVYRYDDAARRVEWEPGIGRRDAVRGWAEFAEHEGGCEMRYALTPSGPAVEPRDDAATLAAAFARWIDATP